MDHISLHLIQATPYQLASVSNIDDMSVSSNSVPYRYISVTLEAYSSIFCGYLEISLIRS